MNEIWKDIYGFEGYYQVSNIGRIKSLERKVSAKNNSTKVVKERILKPALDRRGYLFVVLHKNSVPKTIKIHILVFDAFSKQKRNGRKLQVDHKNGIKTNNWFTNLQLLTNRENISKSWLNRKDSGLPTGVYKQTHQNKYFSSINYNGSIKYLGNYSTPSLASRAYQKALRGLAE